MRWFRLTSATLLLFVFTSCGGPNKEIVGTWKTSSGANESVWEFSPNGTLSADGAPGRYSFGDNKRIKVQTSAATFVHTLEIQGQRMTWTAPDGSKMEFVRVK